MTISMGGMTTIGDQNATLDVMVELKVDAW
jgi:hypothetical protein